MTEDSPDWVPRAVAKVAPQLPGPALRLLCDPRMKDVWRRLCKKAPREVELKEHERRLLKLLGLLNEDASEQACAAFFISVAWTIWNPSGRLVWTKADAEKQATELEGAAAWSRWFATEPMFAEHHAAATEMADVFQKHAISLRERGYLANLEREVEPYVLGRSSGLRGPGDDKIRGYTRAIAADAHRIFGSWLYGTVATVATVALEPDKEVSPKSVENWCSDLQK